MPRTSTWTTALKKWNQDHGSSTVWMVPRKGSPEMAQVKAMMPAPSNKRKKGGKRAVRRVIKKKS